jgi:hypothetical protein
MQVDKTKKSEKQIRMRIGSLREKERFILLEKTHSRR